MYARVQSTCHYLFIGTGCNPMSTIVAYCKSYCSPRMMEMLEDSIIRVLFKEWTFCESGSGGSWIFRRLGQSCSSSVLQLLLEGVSPQIRYPYSK